ncbi:transcription initiation factor IIF [Paraphoma chrysanthemicola]|nr:transcription initiation factor IIF [Paraphoma chrysanthemicola]
MNGVKPDPDVKTEDLYMDDDFYEDTGELALPPQDGSDNVWLARIPDYLYSAISNWDELAEGNDDDQIQIGEVFGFATTSGIDKTKPMRVFFNDRWHEKAKLPTAFQLDPTPTSDQVLGNTYVFTEKDLPGYRPTGYGQGNRGGYGGYGSTQDPKSRVQKRSRYKKAIPKQTVLIGHATRHYNANPLETKEYKDFNALRIKRAIQGTERTTIISKESESLINNSKLVKHFDGFLKPTSRTKSQQNKAARVSREELVDMLHAAFDEFQYWPMKALKMRTKQPEQFLKEVLAEIAQLVRSGPFASTWRRQEIYNAARNLSQQQQGAAEAAESDGEEEMEDVV